MVFQRLVKVNYGSPLGLVIWIRMCGGIWGIIEEAAVRDGRGIKERGGEGEDNSERRNFVRFAPLIPRSAGGGRRHRGQGGVGTRDHYGIKSASSRDARWVQRLWPALT